MRLDYKFSNLCGVVYGGGNLEYSIDGTELFASAGKRVTHYDLVNSTSFTFPFALPNNVSRIALCPGGRLLLAIDQAGNAVLASIPHRRVLHRVCLSTRARVSMRKGTASRDKSIQENSRPASIIASFSPCGKYLATSEDARIRIWATPQVEQGKSFAPLRLILQMAGHSDDIVSFDWGRDSNFILTASLDMTARVYDLRDLLIQQKIIKESVQDLDSISEAQINQASIDSSDNTFDSNNESSLAISSDISENIDTSMDIIINKERLKKNSIELKAHRHPLVGAFFAKDGEVIITVGRNGSMMQWRFHTRRGLLIDRGTTSKHTLTLSKHLEDQHDDGHDKVGETNHQNEYYKGNPNKVNCVAFSSKTSLLLVGFGGGAFALYSVQRPFQMIYSLSVSNTSVNSVAISSSGEWLALGSSSTGQLAVWEWRSESFILKQSGHAAPITCISYSPDARHIATGGADGSVRLWDASGALSIAVFHSHNPGSAVKAISFAQNSKILFSAGDDGTVRAYDLVRLRPFRVMAAPQNVSLSSVAAEASGEIVVASSVDSPNIYMWSVQTGRLLDTLSRHTAPVSGLSFSPRLPGQLASISWDGSLLMWPLFSRDQDPTDMKSEGELLSIASCPHSGNIAVVSISGSITIWDTEDETIVFSIDAKRDYANTRLTAAQISSIAFSPDGTLLAVAGSFPFILIYHGQTGAFLRRIDLVSRHESKKTDTREPQYQCLLTFSPTGRSIACLTKEGMLIYSVDGPSIATSFDPIDLDVGITPKAVQTAIDSGDYIKSLLIALRLNIPSLTLSTWLAIDGKIAEASIIPQLPRKYVVPLLAFFASICGKTNRLGLLTHWLRLLLQVHASVIKVESSTTMPHLRELLRNLLPLHANLSTISFETVSLIKVILSATP